MINYIEHHIVDHCNLNCASCSHFSPLSEPWFENFEDFSRDFFQLSKITNQQINWVRIMGGEPLLHPQIEDFLIESRKLFPFSRIELATNGLLIKKKGQIFADICNQYQIYVSLSDYGILDPQTTLKNFKFVGYTNKQTSMYNPCLDLYGKQDINNAFSNCELHINHWNFFQRGRLYPCCVMGNIHIFNKYFNQNIYTEEDDLSISVYDHTEEEILSFLNSPREICKFCKTQQRNKTYHPFGISKKDISEWII